MTSARAPKLKVCAITNINDAKAALDAGADWLGLIAVPNTPRFIDAEFARLLAEAIRASHPEAYLVGVFQNAQPDEVEAYARQVQLNAIQLHGQENPAEYAHLDLPLIKVIHLHPQLGMSELQMQVDAVLQQPNVITCLLDLPKGSGLKSLLDWPNFHRLHELTIDVPCMVAGGLNVENISPVLEALAPWGVDVASGVEREPGRKDLQKLNAFCALVKEKSKGRHMPAESSTCSTSTGERHSCNP
jgi:phosphoribosylanthranilate isomerase